MSPNPIYRDDPETRWEEMIRKLQIIGRLAISTHDGIERVFEEEVQRRVDASNLTPRADAIVDDTPTSAWQKLWRRIMMVGTVWINTYYETIQMLRDEVDRRVAIRYHPPSNTIEESPRSDLQPPKSSESDYSSSEPRIYSPRPIAKHRVFSWSENSRSTPTKQTQLKRHPHMTQSPFSDGIESDIRSWSVEDDGVDATDWGCQMMDALEEGAQRAAASIKSPSLAPRRSEISESHASSRRRAVTLPLTASIPKVYEINTPRSRSLTHSTAVRDPIGLRRVRFALDIQDEEGVGTSNMEGG